MPDQNSLYFKVREKVRLNTQVAKVIYFAQSLKHSNSGEFRKEVLAASKNLVSGTRGNGEGIALCVRIRDEARYLGEFIEYYLAAGIDHFFFYEKLSKDRFHDVLDPYIDRGIATLNEDWPHVPVSPAAEQDCILQCVGRFAWVGFIDADEFVVIKDGRSIGEFLTGYTQYPAVALHWRGFGSNGHMKRPAGPVIIEYNRRERAPNRHVKCFVQPSSAAAYRNSHSWYYRGMRTAVNELRRPVLGSISLPPTAETAWINHYHHKSDEDYFEKAARKSVLDSVGISFQNRTLERRNAAAEKSNEVVDDVASEYYLHRCQTTGREQILLQRASSAALR